MQNPSTKRTVHTRITSKMNNKLLFTLCRTCSKNHQQTPYQHNDEEISLTGTWVTDELKKALEKGYVVQRIYEVWHFDETEQYDPKMKPWFNQECYKKRKEYHKDKSYNWRVKSVESKNNLVRCSKEYKNVCNTQYNEYRKNFV